MNITAAQAAAAVATQATANAAANSSQSTPATAPATTDPLANENTFLKLLVAQIQNQDPLQPTDSIQFVTQLAQFSSLEQLVSINQGIKTLDQPPGTSTQPTSKP
jgi:flagellar basal-body rod modification protein FlgD